MHLVYDIANNNNNYVSFSGDEILIKNPYDFLPQEDADKILIYLGIIYINNKKIHGCYKISNTIENRIKAENAEIAIKKILEKQYKIAEEFINSFINDKEGK